MAGAWFPCSSIVYLPAAARGENGGGALMGGPPHMVPYSAVCALHLIAVSQLRRTLRLAFSVPFYCSYLGLQEEVGTEYWYRIQSDLWRATLSGINID